MKNTPTILWLASWYPTQLDPYTGDFIQRHARALALHIPVQVLHIIKDTHGELTHSTTTVESMNGQLKETIVYYRPLQTGIPLLDKIISSLTFYNVGKKAVLKKIAASGLNPIVVDVQVAIRAGILALWLQRKWGIPYCITEHWAGYYKQLMPKNLQRNATFWMLTRNIFKKATFFRPVTKNLGQLVNNGICSIAYRDVPNAVDTQIFNYNNPPDAPTFQFLHVSTLGHQKNILGILNVIAKLATHENVPKLILRLVGPASKELIGMVNSHQALKDRVNFSGSISYEMVAQEMKRSHALLMFSRYENLPCTILEALCCGLPVIATRVGGIAEHVNYSNGCLVESGDETALENAILEMVHQYQHYDRPQISAVSISKYNYATVGNMLLANYREFYPQYFNEVSQ